MQAPKPGFTTPEPPDAQLGKLYEFKVTSSTPQTIRYEVTSGALPDGQSLNSDTGAITGIPTANGAAKFTITARNGGGIPDASISYGMKVTPVLVSPQVISPLRSSPARSSGAPPRPPTFRAGLLPHHIHRRRHSTGSDHVAGACRGSAGADGQGCPVPVLRVRR